MSPTMHYLAAALLIVALPASAQFRWNDATGQTNYGDAPPADAKNLVRLDARSGGEDVTAGLPFDVRRAMSQFPVTLYTADACEPCEQARLFLRRRGVPFSELMVETDLEGAELKRRTGTDSVPVMTLGRLPQIGFQPKEWTAALDAAGYPPQITLPATYRAEPPRMLLPTAAGLANRAPADAATRGSQ
jgi:glutaredoxin